MNERKRTNDETILGETVDLHLKAAKKGTNKGCKPFSRQMMIFCMTIAGYSKRAYCSLRRTLEKCIPSLDTLTKYRNRVDGTPGFSKSAIDMIKTKVNTHKSEGKQLYLSLSSDDISIRSHLWFDGKHFFGTEDIGDGPGKERA